MMIQNEDLHQEELNFDKSLDGISVNRVTYDPSNYSLEQFGKDLIGLIKKEESDRLQRQEPKRIVGIITPLGRHYYWIVRYLQLLNPNVIFHWIDNENSFRGRDWDKLIIYCNYLWSDSGNHVRFDELMRFTYQYLPTTRFGKVLEEVSEILEPYKLEFKDGNK